MGTFFDLLLQVVVQILEALGHEVEAAAQIGNLVCDQEVTLDPLTQIPMTDFLCCPCKPGDWAGKVDDNANAKDQAGDRNHDGKNDQGCLDVAPDLYKVIHRLGNKDGRMSSLIKDQWSSEEALLAHFIPWVGR